MTIATDRIRPLAHSAIRPFHSVRLAMVKMPRSPAVGPSRHAFINAWRLAVPLVGWSLMSACSSSFFQITPEEGAARPATKPAVEKPAPKPAQKKPETVAEKPPEKPREEKKPPVVSKPQEKPAEKPPAASTPPVAPPVVRRPEPVIVEPPPIEPTPAGSDSAGIVRLMHAAALWDAVRLFHPGAIANPGAWDNAAVRRMTDIRTANTQQQYETALQRWLASLNDAVSRVHSVADTSDGGTISSSAGGVNEVVSQTQTVVSGTKKARIADTTLILTWPQGLSSVDTIGWSSMRAVLRKGVSASQIVIDLRGRPYAPAQLSRDSARLAMQRDVASLLTSLSLAGPGIRQRAYAGWADEREELGAPSTAEWRTSEPLVVVKGQASPQPRRVVFVADASTEMAPAIMALVSNKQATLVSESALSDRLWAPSVQVSMGNNIRATIRTGELINADGSVGVRPDTIVAPRASPADSAPVLRTAILVARGKLQVGSVEARLRADTYNSPRDNAGFTAASWNSAHYPTMGARLLAAFKMWATLRNFHAYNSLRDENIDDALYRIIPRVEAATDAYSYAAVMLDFASTASDAQARLNSPTLEQHIGAASAPFATRWIEGRAIVTQIAATDAGRASGLAIGDEIVSADGYPMSAYVNEHRRHGAASNDWTRLRNTMSMIPRGAPGATNYRVRDANNRERSVSIERTTENSRKPLGIDRFSNSIARDLGSGFAYIDLARATTADLEGILPGLPGLRAFIVDARGAVDAPANETWPAALRIVLQRTMQTSSAVVGTEILRLASEPCPPAESQMPSTPCVIDRRQFDKVVSADTSLRYRGRVVVLIDERTEGVMEQFAMAMETAANATLIGNASAGAVGAVTAMRVPGLMTFTFSSTELRRPDGGQIQRVGLTPQVESRPTVKGIRAGTDDVLERAQQWLKEQLDPQPVRRRR